MLRVAREMIAAGELGEVWRYRGVHAEDYMADPGAPWGFRHDPAGGGALADVGSHALATAEFLLGPIARVMGDAVTAITERPDGRGGRRAVAVARALVRFEGGASGSIEASWIATGRKMQHDFEVYGTKGVLVFTQERLNELHLYSTGDRAGRRGLRRIEVGPEDPPYCRFTPAPGHQLGVNDLKAIEMAGFLETIVGRAGALSRSPRPAGASAGRGDPGVGAGGTLDRRRTSLEVGVMGAGVMGAVRARLLREAAGGAHPEAA